MGNPAIFQGRRTKLLTASGLQLSSGHTIDNDGPENYLGNYNFPTSATTGFSPVTVQMSGGNPVDFGTFSLSAANVAIATTQTNVLGQNPYSLQVTGAGAVSAGQGITTNVFTVPLKAQGKMLSISSAYLVTSGLANLVLSGATTNTFAIYLYNIAAGTYIQPAGSFAIAQGGGTGILSGVTFQTSAVAGEVTYRLIVIVKNASAGSFVLNMDDFYVGPQNSNSGAYVGPLLPVAVTGSWTTNTSYAAFESIEADRANYDITLTLTGAPNATSLTVSLPAGRTIDVSKLSSSGTDGSVQLGVATVLKSATANYAATVKYMSPTSVSIRVNNASGTYDTDVAVSNTVPVTFAAADKVQLIFTVPIVGLSSNQVLSSDTATNLVSAQVSGTPTGTVGTSFASSTTLIHPVVNGDTTGSYSNGVYTIPVPGDYEFGISSQLNLSAATVNEVYFYSLAKNGVEQMTVPTITATAGVYSEGTLKAVGLKAGDLITFRTYRAGGSTTATLAGGVITNYVNIKRLASPQTIAASESVNATYGLTTSQAVGANAVIKYDTRVKDTGGGLYDPATGLFTAPISGMYCISVVANGNGTTANLYIKVAGISAGYLGTTTAVTTSGSLEFPALAGQTIGIYTDTSATFASGIVNGFLNQVTFERTGN